MRMIGRIKGRYNTWLIIDITNLILCFLHLRVFELKQIINDNKKANIKIWQGFMIQLGKEDLKYQ